MTELGFRAPEACRLAGITYRQCDWWARCDLVVPSLAEAHGSGTQRRYSTADILALRIVLAVSTLGGFRSGSGVSVNSPMMREALRVVRARFDARTIGSHALLVVAGTGARVLFDPGDVDALAFTDVPLLLVPLGPLLDGLGT